MAPVLHLAQEEGSRRRVCSPPRRRFLDPELSVAVQKGDQNMFGKCFLCFFAAAFLFPVPSRSQTSQSSAAASVCPVEIMSFDPAGVSAHIRNTSRKTIVGLVFNAAIADATEHWKWVHWDFDDGRPLREFGWNKAIKPSATKRLTWGWGTYLDFAHIGGGAFVLTSALFDDGSRWDAPSEGNSCRRLWYKHKRSAFRPVELPPRVATLQ